MDDLEAAVLCALASGSLSHESLTTRLDRSLAAIEDAVDALQTVGLVSNDRDGFALSESVAYTESSLATVVPDEYGVRLFETVNSTNDRAKHLEIPPDRERLLVVAKRQRAGRGRHRRRWRSPRGGIWASVLDRRSLPAETGWVEQLAMALAVTDVLDSLGLEGHVKWPNDVLLARSGKVAGVLVETTVADGERTETICGVGMNVAVDPADVPPGGTTLIEHIEEPVLAAVLAHLLHAFERWRSQPARTINRWRQRSQTIGRTVHVDTTEGPLIGRATAVTESGALVIETDAGRQTIPPEQCHRLRYASTASDPSD